MPIGLSRREALEQLAAGIFIGSTPVACGAADRRIVTREQGIVHDDVTDQTSAVQSLVDRIGKLGGGTLIWSPGIVRTSYEIVLPSNISIVGEDETSGIRNVSKRGGNTASPFRIGYWALFFNGHRPVGSSRPYLRGIDMFPAARAIRAADKSVTLADVGNVGHFRIGEIAFLRSREARSQISSGVDLELPLESSLVKIAGVDPATGAISFEMPMGFDTVSPPYLCRLQPDAGDSNGRAYFAENVRIEGLRLFGRSACGSVSTGMYNCHFKDLGGSVDNIVIANGFAHCSFRGFSGEFGQRAVETKFCAHDSSIGDITAHSRFSGRGEGMFSIGEGCRNVAISNVEASAPEWTGGHLFQLQPGRDCSFSYVAVSAPRIRNVAAMFYADAWMPLENVTLDRVRVEHGSQNAIVFASGIHEPIGCRVLNSEFTSTAASDGAIAVAFNGGLRNRVEGCRFNKGGVRFSGRALGNVVRNSTTGTRDAYGAAIRNNNVSW